MKLCARRKRRYGRVYRILTLDEHPHEAGKNEVNDGHEEGAVHADRDQRLLGGKEEELRH